MFYDLATLFQSYKIITKDLSILVTILYFTILRPPCDLMQDLDADNLNNPNIDLHENLYEFVLIVIPSKSLLCSLVF